MKNKIFLGEDKIISDVAFNIKPYKGYVKPCFIKDAILKIIRKYYYISKNVIKIYF